MPRYGALSKLELFPEVNLDNISNFVTRALNAQVEVNNTIQQLTLEYNIDTARAATINQIYDQLNLTSDLVSRIDALEQTNPQSQVSNIKAKFFSEIEELLD